MTTITANMPERKVSFGGKSKVYPATVKKFEKVDGNWFAIVGNDKTCIFESDVIQACRGAKNWNEIKQTHFSMADVNKSDSWA